MQELGLERRHSSPSGTETSYRDLPRYRGQSSASSGYDESHQEDVEVPLNIIDDSVSLHSMTPLTYEDPGKSLLGQDRPVKKSNSVLKRIASSVSSELRRVVPSVALTSAATKPSGPPLAPFRRSESKAEQAIKGLKFITNPVGVAGWPGVEKKFDELTEKTNGVLLRSEFGACIDEKKKKKPPDWSKSRGFALALFDGLARMHNITEGVINKDQLRTFWEQINDQDFDSRLRTFFAMFDKDADGRLNEDDVREIENLEVLLLQAPDEAMKNLSQELEVSASRNLWERLFRGMMYSALDNWKRVWVMALWIAVMTGLFTWKFIEYRKRPAYQVMGACVCIAKGAGETLKLNMAMVLLPVCRNTITWLRTKTKLSVVVPFNDNLNFHKVIAIAISIGVAIHATAHLACDFPRLIAADEETYKPMEQYFGVQPKSYVEFLKSVEVLTGTSMIILLTITFTLATTWFRRNKLDFLPKSLKKITGFNAFWYTHHLFVIVYILLVLHGYYVYLIKTWYRKTTWMYLMVPMVLYLSERLVRSLRSRIEAVKILKIVRLPGDRSPGDLLVLHMSKPNNFRYKSGQYIYLKCSAVSSLEWHPFSISSAPGDDDLSVHIKCEGDWTDKLLTKFSPSQDYKNFEVVLLVGLGSGVTPMISIVKDIINNLKDNGKTEKAYFYWSTRHEITFHWFQSVMDEVAEADHNKVIEVHNHCTGIHQAADVRSSLITMLQTLYHAKNGRDVVSRTRFMSHFNRPNWRSIYKRIAMEQKNKRVGVFYCGLPSGVEDHQRWSTYFSRETTTKFCFHKENF
ncbi:hypothetical protein Bca52824_005689 [Brassica carinata]|uniref:Uncharacterized protein n=1 Tax=Brassica carinata TaxID=52824 RepID=A0A8X8BD86_BRACI|nr:hypothetical protein Bca52824_005689 [Brassica carinata]